MIMLYVFRAALAVMASQVKRRNCVRVDKQLGPATLYLPGSMATCFSPLPQSPTLMRIMMMMTIMIRTK